MNPIKKSLQRLKKWVGRLMYSCQFRMTDTDRDRIVFNSNGGKNYTGSPRAVYEYMLQNGMLDRYEVVWAFCRGVDHSMVPGSPRVVEYRSWAYFREMMRAHVWVFDARNVWFLKKRDTQHYIQIWHGTPLKRLALDMEHCEMPVKGGLEQYKWDFLQNTKIWDYMVVQNAFSERIFRSCFAFDREFLRIGYPRNDILFEMNNARDIDRLKEELGLPKRKKVLLYAPTYRDDEFDEDGEYTFETKLDIAAMQAALSDEYVLIVKYHYLVAKTMDLTPYAGFAYSYYTDMDINRLYLVSDALITDYSSVMFDFALLKRPVFFYCYDLEKYSKEQRGFYFDLHEEAPGPITETTEELIRALKIPEAELEGQYGARREAFYQKYHTYEDGTASKQLADKILSLMNADREL